MKPLAGLSALSRVAAITVCCGMLIGVVWAVEKSASSTESAKSTKSAASKPDEKPPVGQIKVLVPEREFKKEGPNKALRLTFDDLDIEKVLNTKQLSMDIQEKMPEWMQDLNGERVRLRGFMHPASSFEAEGIRRFIFCRDTSVCCFGPNPTIYYLIETTLKKGQTIDYIENRAFDIEGKLKIKPVKLEGTDEIYQFYFLDDATLIRR